MSNATFEIVIIDAELSECPKTGIRYFGYVKARPKRKGAIAEWQPIYTGYGDLPWFLSQDDLLERAKNFYSETDEVEQVLILKAEIPIKKMVLNNEN